jgi:hypothetical protein
MTRGIKRCASDSNGRQVSILCTGACVRSLVVICCRVAGYDSCRGSRAWTGLSTVQAYSCKGICSRHVCPFVKGMYSLCGKAHEVTPCLLQLRPLTQAKGLVDKIFFPALKGCAGLDLRERDSRPKKRKLEAGKLQRPESSSQ